MSGRIPAKQWSACEVCGDRGDQLPVFPTALLCACTAILREQDGAAVPSNIVCVCVYWEGWEGVSLNIQPVHSQRCRSDKDDSANRTSHDWPATGGGLEDTASSVTGS